MNYRIENSPLGGRGLFANRSLGRGDLILTEDPIVFCNTGSTENQWSDQATVDTFYAAQRIHATSVIYTAVNDLTLEQRKTLRTLWPRPAHGPTLDRYVDRFERNAFTFVNASNNKTHLVVYEDISSINHSCVPNATIEIWPRRTVFPEGQARLVATRAIPDGAEIFVNYMERDWLDNHVARNAVLNHHWGFTCSCNGCTHPFTAMDTISRNLIREYRTNITAMVAAVTEEEKNHSIMNLAGYINILTSLGRWDADLSNACLELARLYFGKEDYAQAKQTAHAGLIVEKNFFIATPSKPQLNEIIGQCHQEDERLLEEYNKAAMGPFSILPM